MVSVSLVLTAVLKTHTKKCFFFFFLIMFCLGCFHYYNVPIASSCSLRNANSVQLVVCSFDPAHIKALKKDGKELILFSFAFSPAGLHPFYPVSDACTEF